MTEISDLKRRVDAVGEKFGRLAEQENSYGDRLSGLLNAVEEGFARSQKETQKLQSELESAQDEVKKMTGELETAKEDTRQRSRELDGVKEEREKLSSELDGAKEEREKLSSELDGAKDESKQLRGMLLALLEAVETGGDLDLGEAMRDLESRIDQIVTSTDSDLDTVPATAPVETKVAELQPATAPAETKVVDLEPVEAAPDEAKTDSREEDTLVLTASAGSAPDDEPAAPADAAPDKEGVDADEVVASAAEPDTPTEPEAAAKPKKDEPPEGRAAEPPSDDDLSAVNKIIQRISLLTGEFVEPSQKGSDTAEDKSVPALKVGNGANDAPATGPGKDKASAKDESAAKTT